MDVIKLSPHASVAEQTTLEEWQQRLDNKIRSFHSKFEAMAEGTEHEELLLQAPQDEGHAPSHTSVDISHSKCPSNLRNMTTCQGWADVGRYINIWHL